MRNWNMEHIEKQDRKEFIIDCLQEYIDEVSAMFEEPCYPEEYDIADISNLYKAIIEELKK